MSEASERNPRKDWDGVWWGLVILSMGAMFLLINAGVLDKTILSTWWVVLPVVFGAARLVMARSAKAVSEGVFLVLIGAWFIVAVTNWKGLTWSTSWPLALVAVGGSSLAEAIASWFLPKRAPGEKECGS